MTRLVLGDILKVLTEMVLEVSDFTQLALVTFYYQIYKAANTKPGPQAHS